MTAELFPSAMDQAIWTSSVKTEPTSTPSWLTIAAGSVSKVGGEPALRPVQAGVRMALTAASSDRG